MKKLEMLTSIIILLSCIVIFSMSYASTDIKSVLTIDTNLENTIFDKTGIHISWWKLATEAHTKLVVFIDGQ